MNFTQHKSVLAVLIGLNFWTANVRAVSETPNYINTQQTLQQGIETIMKQYGIVGMSVALIDDQQVVWAEGFGYADKERHIKAAPETLYRTGSISKLFTATATMQLVEQGKFDIDKPLQTYIPEFAIKTRFPEAGAITPRQLMTHHSGLPSDYFKGFFNIPAEPFKQLTVKLTEEYSAYPPNFIMTYSNLGVSLLGSALENACGEPYGACLEHNLLQPLGMDDSEFATGASASALMSKEYDQGRAVPVTSLRDVPAGGLNSNVLNLSRFVRMVFADGKLDGRQIISGATLGEMLRPQNADAPLDLGQQIGLAWILNTTTNGKTKAWHDGGLGHFHSYVAAIPEHKLGVVILANTGSAEIVVGELADTALQLMMAEKAVNTGSVSAPLDYSQDAKNQVNDFQGHYVSGDLGLVSITGKSSRMRIKFNGRSYSLTQQPDGSLKLDQFGLTLTRARLSGREVLIADGKHKQLLGEKLAKSPLPMVWRKRVGQYRVMNQDGDPNAPQFIRLSVKNGFLMLNVVGLPDRVLTPVNDTEVIIAGLGRSLGETISFESNRGTGTLRYSGYVAKRNGKAHPR